VGHDGVPSTQLAARISIPNVCSPVDPTTKKIAVMPSLNLHVERVFVDMPFNYSSTWRTIVDERDGTARCHLSILSARLLGQRIVIYAVWQPHVIRIIDRA
jgi:hypothetical protein